MNWVHFDIFPQLRPFIFGVMARIEGEVLGEVWLVRVPPGEDYAVAGKPDRQHLYVLGINAAPGVLIGHAEQVMLSSGEIWWANGGLDLRVTNNSAEDLVMLCIRAQPNSPATEMPEPAAA